MVIKFIRSAGRVLVAALFCLVFMYFFLAQIRYTAAEIDLLPTAQASTYQWDDVAILTKTDDKVTVTAEYCSEIVAANDPSNPTGRTSTELEFDDSWFAQDSRTYNHELATSCAVLSAICNSESQFYGYVDGAIPYAEQALGSLGFKNIRTESYTFRSQVVDQFVALFTGSHDEAAYAFASKTIAGQKGEPDETLIFVGVRGSYGIEWLSNFKFAGAKYDSDHWGYKHSETEIAEALSQYARDIGADPEHTKMLITGHSRGGSIANLLAADLVDRSGMSNQGATVSEIYAYTFAAPSSTQLAEDVGNRYSNIFNIVNTSDIIPQMPLDSWGFERYGMTVALPEVGDRSFSEEYSAMQASFHDNTGFMNPCDTVTLDELGSFNSRAEKTLPSFNSLLSFEGIYGAVKTILGTDVAMALSTHYPDTYIAWMQSIDARQLSF